jgi:uncharacterized protein
VEIYLDTSALVKLYLVEPDHDTVIGAIQQSSAVATSMVAYAEARSAFARRFRENALDGEEHLQLVTALDNNWMYFNRVPVSESIAYVAGDLAERHALRGFDAIHLASAMSLQEHFDNLHFLAFDERLMHAARQMMPVYEVE